MPALVTLLISQLPSIISLANKLTGSNLPAHIVEDGQKLYEFANNTIQNLKQNVPLTPEQDKELDAMIEEITSRDYWKSKDK